MRFGTWNVRSLFRVGSLIAAAGKLARYKLYLVGVQEVRWENRGVLRRGDCNFSYGKKLKFIKWEQDILYTAE